MSKSKTLSLMATFAVLIVSTLSFGQDVKTTLFKDADAAMKSAQKAHANVLAPKNYGEAMKYYNEANEDYSKGKNLEDIRKKLRASISYFTKATEATKLADVTFTSSIKARADAQVAESAKFANELWRQAEGKFAEGATKLEDGNVNDAKKKASEAETLYRQAELDAVKANYLKETWDLLEQADRTKVKDRAPKTLAKAQKLIQQAEKELNTNRYDTDVARNLASQAKYQAKHAIFLANTVNALKDSKKSMEDFLLATEQPLEKIANSIDVVAEFDQGYSKPTDAIISYITTYQDSAAKLSQTLAELDQQVGNLQARVGEMEEQLGAQQKEKSALAQRIEAQAKLREQFASVEQMFDREEARVMREGNDVIMRLTGLTFESGSTTILPKYFGLLTKVQSAIRVFPGSTISIEGHTDSFGGDAQNLRLSQERAEAVRQYLIANMGLSETTITSVGYGESKPFATNETADGRTRNRRIEVVIYPNTGGTF